MISHSARHEPDAASENPRAVPGEIVVRLVHGLGNRLSGLLSAMVIADKLKLKLEVYWARDATACTALFHELFEVDGTEEVTFSEEDPGAIEWTHYGAVTADRVAKAVANGGTFYVQAFNFFGSALFDHFEYYERLRVRMHLMKPVEAVRRVIERVPAATVGFHVRMSDHLPSRVITPRWCYREALKKILNEEPKATVYVCSDTPAAIDEFLRMSPERVFASPEIDAARNAPRSSLPALHAALAELWLLSRCQTIVASPPSSFAALASVLSGGTFIRIAAWSSRLVWRIEKVLWPFYRCLWYDIGKHRWTPRGDRGPWFAPLGLAAVMAARVLFSKFYQDWVPHFQRRAFLTRLDLALKR